MTDPASKPAVFVAHYPVTEGGVRRDPTVPENRQALKTRIRELLKQQNAVLVAHYYTDAEIQDIAEETGGCVSDSLEMAKFGSTHPATTLLVAGVRFMGETAKILNPEKRVLMANIDATCSLDLGCPADEFGAFCDQYPDRTVVVYANTSAKVKARADWVVTSSIAEKVIRHLAEQGKKILWAPDKHLGHYLQVKTGADMVIWQAACVVHEAFKAEALKRLKEKHPDAAVLVHPESPDAVVQLADIVGSTTQLIKAAANLPQQTMIVATDSGILHKMRQAAPGKLFIEAPTAGAGATCVSCAHCPWMAMNTLEGVASVLETGANEINIDPAVRKQAMISTQRMIDFSNSLQQEPKSIARFG